MAEDGDAPFDTDNDNNNVTITQDLLTQLFYYAQQMQNTAVNKFTTNHSIF